MQQITRAQKVKSSLLAAISAFFLFTAIGCSNSVLPDDSGSGAVETALQTEVANQLAASTQTVTEIPLPTSTVESQPTRIATEPVEVQPTLESVLPAWYAKNVWQSESEEVGFAKVKRFPAVLYASPEDAVLKAQKKRTIPGDEVYVSYLSTTSVNETVAYEIEPGGWMAADQLEEIQPSHFAGIQIQSEPDSDFGWVVVPGFSFLFSPDEPNRKESGHYYKRYQFLLVRSVMVDGNGMRWHEIGENEWISDDLFSLVQLRETSPTQVYSRRWIDVDLTEQNLVVYEEGNPVFATLISTGAEQGWTGAGVFTVYNQIEAYDLLSPDPKAIGNYYLEDVPWILFYEGSWAIHGTYWHDAFGLPNSHGCVNMSMTDAGWLYNWAQPSDYIFLFW